MSFAGADCSVPLAPHHLDLAQSRLGAAPLVWGRYFNGFHATAAEYLPSEAGLFRAANLKLLPIAQQTPKVGGNKAAGAKHAAMNVEKFITRIGFEQLAASGTEYLMFLDVEGDAENPSLSADYFVGWSNGIVTASGMASNGRFVVLPAVYARTNDDATWHALAAAHADGAHPCRAVWVTRQHFDACTKPMPEWQSAFLTPGVALPCPIVCWQYAIDCPDGDGVDLELLTPTDADRAMLLDRLVVP